MAKFKSELSENNRSTLVDFALLKEKNRKEIHEAASLSRANILNGDVVPEGCEGGGVENFAPLSESYCIVAFFHMFTAKQIETLSSGKNIISGGPRGNGAKRSKTGHSGQNERNDFVADAFAELYDRQDKNEVVAGVLRDIITIAHVFIDSPETFGPIRKRIEDQEGDYEAQASSVSDYISKDFTVKIGNESVALDSRKKRVTWASAEKSPVQEVVKKFLAELSRVDKSKSDISEFKTQVLDGIACSFEAYVTQKTEENASKQAAKVGRKK